MKLQDILGNIGKLKTEVEQIITRNSSVAEASKTVQDFVKQTESELKNIVEKDLPKLVKRLASERAAIEKTVEKAIKTEFKKAQEFAKSHKKELDGLQSKVEAMLKKQGLHLPESLSSKRTKTTKKTAKKTAKKATKKKASKSILKKKESPKTPKLKKDHLLKGEKTKVTKRPTRKVTAR